MPWQELLQLAQQQLRCIESGDLTRDLLVAGSASDAFEASRPVAKGEVIDFFLTHSWHDDGNAKYDTLEEAAKEFIDCRRRSPSFWLDKACIDQTRISDGLRVLPVNVMACARMLIAHGPTYCGSRSR